NFNIIEKGVLNGHMLGLYVANKTGRPVVRSEFGAVVIEGGDISLDDMIKGVDRGIIVGSFSGGAPGTNGEFSGVAKNAFLVENGRISGAVSEVMINGNLGQIFGNISAISRETVCDGGSVLPYMAFPHVVVSGK
ncbi:MAG: TldD/PmbA family protein, partial [Clostridia bacterium]|nr:TldD/PmbA family protein [Clostridia bacterium]